MLRMASSRTETYPHGKRVRERRLSMNLTQVDVARKSKLSEKRYQDIERGLNTSIRSLRQVAIALGCDLEDLTGRESIRLVTPYDSNQGYRVMVDALDAVNGDDREEIVRHAMWSIQRARPMSAAEDNILEFVPARREVIAEHDDFRFPVPPSRFREGDFDYPQDWHYWRDAEDRESDQYAAGPSAVIGDGQPRILNPPNPTEVFDRLQKIIRVKGDSMLPRYMDGDLLRVDTTRRTPRDGEPVAVYITDPANEGGIIGTLRHDGDRVSLSKRNPLFTAVDLPERGWVLIGVVAEIVSRKEQWGEREVAPPVLASEAASLVAQLRDDDARTALLFLRNFASAEQITSRSLREQADAEQAAATNAIITGPHAEASDSDRGDRRPSGHDQPGRVRRTPLRRDPDKRDG
jgi:transcriptional regulator with XRE-family HTH domain